MIDNWRLPQTLQPRPAAPQAGESLVQLTGASARRDD